MGTGEWIFAILVAFFIISLLNTIDDQLRRIAKALEDRNAKDKRDHSVFERN